MLLLFYQMKIVRFKKNKVEFKIDSNKYSKIDR